MENIQNNKINLLKALAIMIVVAGHLEFSLIPMFPPYSFQVILFFFIAGMLFNPKYTFFQYFKRRFKSLLIPYFIYCFVYLGITCAITPLINKFWGMKINLYNELVIPFLSGHQLDLISPLWFVPCLFITLLIYKLFSYIKCSDYLKLGFYFLLALLAIHFQSYAQNINFLWIFRSMFALLFVHLGYLYRNNVQDKTNIFTPKIVYLVLILQSILWLTNKDFTAMDGVGLHFLLVWGQYNNWIVPILTSLTGIYISLFIIELLYKNLNWSFIHKIGRNSYHIMANHLLIFNILTYMFLYIKGIPFDIKDNSDIYWFYFPLKTTYLYFIVGIISTTYLGEFFKLIKRAVVDRVFLYLRQLLPNQR